MKEYIFQPTIAQDGASITISNAPTGLTKQNILAIINKSIKGIVHSPLLDGIQSLSYSGSTLTINLKSGHVSIAGELIIKAYQDSSSSEGGGGSENLEQFFNITEATEYTALTSAEAIAIARDCQYNVMGTDWPIPTWLPTGVTEAQVESAAEGLGIPYHEPTQTA